MPENTVDTSISGICCCAEWYAGVVMSKFIYNMDYRGMLSFANDLSDFPDTLVPCLHVFVASVNASSDLLIVSCRVDSIGASF